MIVRSLRRPPARRRPHTLAASFAVALLFALALPLYVFSTVSVRASGVLRPHAVVFPHVSTPGAYEKYVLRVPNERPVPTRQVEISFPPEVRVVSFAEVPGWTLEVRTDWSHRVTGAVWTGEIGVERFVEFPFVAVNPTTEGKLTWAAVQTYANAERVSWSGPEGSETPASFTEIRADAEEISSPVLPLALSVAALLVAAISLAIAIRRPRGAGRHAE